MNKKNIWSIKLTTASLLLIPAAVGVNYIGKLFASLLKLPLWLDSIGTVLASMLAGPIVGALAGATNNIIFGLTADPISFIYGITSVAIGLVTGYLAYKGWVSSWSKALLLGLVVSATAIIISTPLNVFVWGGQTGNLWGDALFAVVLAKTDSIWLASFLDELVVDLPDKVITVLISYGLFKGLPNQLTNLYGQIDHVETLD